MKRFAVGAVLVGLLVTASGCGSSGSGTPKGRTGPNTEGVLLTVLNYGRAANAKEVCPLLSTAYAKRTGGGDPAKCGTLGQRTLCPCVSQSLATNSISVNGDTSTAKVTRQDGSTLTLTLVRQGNDWKVDNVQRGA